METDTAAVELGGECVVVKLVVRLVGMTELVLSVVIGVWEESWVGREDGLVVIVAVEESWVRGEDGLECVIEDVVMSDDVRDATSEDKDANREDMTRTALD
jgi:hypothetical protein